MLHHFGMRCCVLSQNSSPWIINCKLRIKSFCHYIKCIHISFICWIHSYTIAEQHHIKPGHLTLAGSTGIIILRPPFNSLVLGRLQWHFRWVIFMLILVIDDWCISCEIAVRWMSLDLTDDKSTLVQVMAWCRQATSHYLNQCWPRSVSPYGVIKPQWVKSSHCNPFKDLHVSDLQMQMQ